MSNAQAVENTEFTILASDVPRLMEWGLTEEQIAELLFADVHSEVTEDHLEQVRQMAEEWREA